MNLGSGSSNSQQSQKSFQPSFGESGNSTPRGDHEEEQKRCHTAQFQDKNVKTRDIQSSIFEIEICSRNLDHIQDKKSSIDSVVIPCELQVAKKPVFSEEAKGLYNLSEKRDEDSDVRTGQEIEEILVKEVQTPSKRGIEINLSSQGSAERSHQNSGSSSSVHQFKQRLSKLKKPSKIL